MQDDVLKRYGGSASHNGTRENAFVEKRERDKREREKREREREERDNQTMRDAYREVRFLC